MKTAIKATPLRREIGRTACYEIGQLAMMLHDYIERHDPGGEACPAMRGGLLRLSKLSDIIFETLIAEKPDQSDTDLIHEIGGMQCLGALEDD